jgi:hypothetical protein
MNLYEAIDVWKRISSTELICYKCFRNLQTNMFSVQSSDFYNASPDPNRVSFLQRQYLELLLAEPPDKRTGGFETLLEAVQAHDKQFNAGFTS